MSDRNVAGPAGPCPSDGGCPCCRGWWPKSGLGKAVILIVALAALGVVVAYETMRSDLAKLDARYEGLKAAGRHDAAAKAMGEIVDAADALYRARRFDDAARAFEWVASKDPKRALALERLGVMARDRGDADKAVEWFTRAAEVDPLSPQHAYNLALIHYARKDYAACETRLRDAMKLSPVKSQYRLLFAFCAQEMKQPSDIVKKRYRDVIDAVEAQAHVVGKEELAPDGSLARVWKTAADRLAALNDAYGRDRMKKLAADAKRPETREFAKKLLALKS